MRGEAAGGGARGWWGRGSRARDGSARGPTPLGAGSGAGQLSVLAGRRAACGCLAQLRVRAAHGREASGQGHWRSRPQRKGGQVLASAGKGVTKCSDRVIWRPSEGNLKENSFSEAPTLRLCTEGTRRDPETLGEAFPC